jgi:hypothetical protein
MSPAMARRGPGSVIGQAFCTLLCLVAGVAVTFFFGLPMYCKAQASQNWPTTTGKIAMSQVSSHYEKGKTNYSASVGYTVRRAERRTRRSSKSILSARR